MMSVQKRLLPAGTPPPQRPAPPQTTGRQVLRVNRACTSCRRQKMRCDGPDNPPCTRCRVSGQQCVFEKVPKPDQLDTNALERLTELETDIAAVKGNQTQMQSTLTEILMELRKQHNSRPTTMSSNSGETGTIAATTSPPSFNGQYIEPIALPMLTSTPKAGILSSPRTSFRSARPGENAGTHVSFAVSPRPMHQTMRMGDAVTPYRDSGVSSPANSEVDIPAHALIAPIEVINDLAGSPPELGRLPRKRKRTESFGADEFGVDQPRHSRTRGDSASFTAREKDVIEKGLISENEAKELFSLYFSGCSRILAMFDPKKDTFESLRQRSPFCLCCVLMVGAKVRDGGKQPSQIQLLLEKEATDIAKETIFLPVKQIEVVQGLLLIAAWGYSTGGTGWMVAGHAVRCAVELGLHKALQRLAYRLRAGSAIEEMDHELVRASRTWCALFVFEYQLAFGMRRPAMMGDEAKDHINLARDTLLKHPLSIPTDIRLVSTCQLLCIQYQIHQSLGFGREEGRSEQYTLEVLREGRRSIDAWQNEWDSAMSANHTPDGFFRSSAAIQRAYAHLFYKSLVIQNIRTKAQAKTISPEIKAVAFEAVEAAKEALNIVLHSAEYKEGLRFAISYTHTCAAFAAGFLLRMARLFPNDINPTETCTLVENVAKVLNEVPGKRFSEALYGMVASFRQRQRSNSTHTDTTRPLPSEVNHEVPSVPPGLNPDAFYSVETFSEGSQIPDPLFPSWLTDLQLDGAALDQDFLQAHFG